jgi:hypothetical protein
VRRRYWYIDGGGRLCDRTADADLRAKSDFLEILKNVSEVEIRMTTSHTLKHRVDHLECLIDLLSNLGTSQDNLAGDEDEKDDLGLDHTIDETREQLRLIRAEVVMTGCKTFQANGELDIARADDVLDLEVGELGVETELLNDTSIFARGKLGIILRLGTSDNHLSRREDQSGGLGVANTHDDSSESLRRLAKKERG